MSPDANGLMEIRQTHCDSAAIATRADDKHPHRLPRDKVAREHMLDAHAALPPLNELRERLRQLDQGFCRECPPFAREFGPQGVVPAIVPRQTSHVCMGECALVEALFPSLNRSHGRAFGASHRTKAYRSVVREIPERSDGQLCPCIGPLVFGKRANAQAAVDDFPDQWWLRESLSVQLLHLAFRALKIHL